MIQLRDPERCPKCGGPSRVMESRNTGMARWRRRKCRSCLHRWRTYESLINPAFVSLTRARRTT